MDDDFGPTWWYTLLRCVLCAVAVGWMLVLVAAVSLLVACLFRGLNP